MFLGKLVWARPDDDFEAAQANVRNCPVVAADRVPEPGRNTSVAPDNVVQQYPSGQHTFSDTAAEGHGPSSGFSMRPQRRTYSKSFKAQVIQECSEPGASIANIALGYSLNANPRPQMDSAAYPENHGYPASVHPVAFSNARRVRILKRATAIMRV